MTQFFKIIGNFLQNFHFISRVWIFVSNIFVRFKICFQFCKIGDERIGFFSSSASNFFDVLKLFSHNFYQSFQIWKYFFLPKLSKFHFCKLSKKAQPKFQTLFGQFCLDVANEQPTRKLPVPILIKLSNQEKTSLKNKISFKLLFLNFFFFYCLQGNW